MPGINMQQGSELRSRIVRLRKGLTVAGVLFIAIVPPAHAGSNTGPVPSLLRLAAADTRVAGIDEARKLDPTDAYRLALLKLKGHIGVARTLLQIDAPGAAYHLRVPIKAIFQSSRDELDRRNAPLTASTLEELERATDAPRQSALATITLATAAIDGSFAQTGGVEAGSALALSEALLRDAVDLYAVAVVDNEVTDLTAYQTGRGFVVQAEALIRHSGGLKSSPGYEPLLAEVVLIRQAWPGVMPPPIVFDAASVAARLEEAIAAMRELKD